MCDDKKNQDGCIIFIFVCGIGNVYIEINVDEGDFVVFLEIKFK